MNLLGAIIQDNLKWDTHVGLQNMLRKANSRKYFILILKRLGVGLPDLVKCYCTFVRPPLEYAVPAWHSGLTTQQSLLLERVQKQTLKILLPAASYDQACAITGLDCLDNRKVELCRRFAMDLINSKAFFDWCPPRRRNCHQRYLRNNEKLSVMLSKSKRFSNSPIAYMTTLLNQNLWDSLGHTWQLPGLNRLLFLSIVQQLFSYWLPCTLRTPWSWQNIVSYTAPERAVLSVYCH